MSACLTRYWTFSQFFCGLVLFFSLGCGLQNSPTEDENGLQTPPASYAVRQTRRAYEGAPPTIPHAPVGASCTACHNEGGKWSPPLGWAPANPHFGSGPKGRFTNCRQCHLFLKKTSDSLADSTEITSFPVAFPVSLHGDRLYPGAPPVIPHETLIRSRCVACHTGPAARPEIVCKHAERKNCRQCHVEQNRAKKDLTSESFAFDLPGTANNSQTTPKNNP